MTATTPSTHAIKPVKRKGLVGAIAILSLLLATCTRPGYALINDCNNYYSNVMNNINYNHHKYYEFVIFITNAYCHYHKQRLTSIDLVAVHGNNATQELRNLLKTVQHRTIADVFLCLSFIGLPFVGKLRLALVRYGEEDTEISLLLGEYRVPFVFSGFEPPYRPIFRANIKTSLPFEKV